MVLIGYRHGLRASELCDLQWSQVELIAGRLYVRRAKSGSPSVHPMQGDEIRALRRLQREQDHPRTYHDRARWADDAKGLSFQSPVTAPQDSEQTVIECVAAFAPHTAKPARRLAR